MDPQLKLRALVNNYDDVDLNQPGAGKDRLCTLQLESELAACHILPSDNTLVQALCSTKDADLEYKRKQTSSVDAAKDRTMMWKGIYLWLARRIGPIPGFAVDTDLLKDIVERLQEFGRDPGAIVYKPQARWGTPGLVSHRHILHLAATVLLVTLLTCMYAVHRAG